MISPSQLVHITNTDPNPTITAAEKIGKRGGTGYSALSETPVSRLGLAGAYRYRRRGSG
jgi:hypothetical protein